MLFKIQKELQQNKNMKLAFAVENDIAQFKKLKKEFTKLSTIIKQQQLTEQMKVFLLLVAIRQQDIIFAEQLIEKFDYKKIDTSTAKLALGRFYEKIGIRKELIENYLAIFEEGLLSELELVTLGNELFEIGWFGDCDRVYNFALAKYPDSLSWKIQVLNYQIKILHLYPAHKESIIGNLKYLYPSCVTVDDFFNIGICFLTAGYFNDGVKMFDAAFQKIQPNLNFKDVKQPFDASQCRESMDEIIDILEPHNFKPFPIAGSLLGLHRDGKFMDHDKDADIGLFVKDYEEICKIVSLICENNKFLCPNMINKPKESQSWNVAIQDHQRSTVVDLFFFYRENTNIVFGIYTPFVTLKWAFQLFELTRQTLAGKEYWLPENIEQHLVEMYGESWRKPIKVWDSLLNCPNLINESQPTVIFFSLMRFYTALDENKMAKALNYYQTLTTKWGMKFSAEAKENIERLLKLNETSK